MSDCDIESDKKRKRSEHSSLSDLDSNLSQEQKSTNCSTKSSRKAERKRAKKKEKSQTKEGTEKIPEEKEGEEDKQAKSQNIQNMDTIHKELKSINERLSKVLTKDDPYLQNVIQDVFMKMKDDFLKSVSHRLDVLENKLFEKDKENDQLCSKIKVLEKAIDIKNEENLKLKKEMEKVEVKSQERFNDLEQYSRRNNFRIDGVEERGNETSSETSEKVVEIISKHMKGVHMNKNDIDIAHRLGKKKDGKRQIIVKMKSRLQTEAIMRNKKSLKGSGIFINEDLTRINQLALSCVRKKLPDEVESAWTRDGRVKYKNRSGNIHTLRFEEYQTWVDLPWPASTTTR